MGFIVVLSSAEGEGYTDVIYSHHAYEPFYIIGALSALSIGSSSMAPSSKIHSTWSGFEAIGPTVHDCPSNRRSMPTLCHDRVYGQVLRIGESPCKRSRVALAEYEYANNKIF